MASMTPRAQAIAIATTEMTTALHRAVGEVLDQHPEWTTTEVLAVVSSACARVTTSVANDSVRAEHADDRS